MREFFLNYYNYFIIGIILFSILIGILLVKQRHHYRIKKGKVILKKIRSFKDSNLELRIINYLKKIDPFTFEELLLTLFEESGCKIKRNRKYTGDGGIDGKFSYKSKKYFLQAKRYSGYIRAADVEAFSNICRVNKVFGLFIHTGKVGKQSVNIINNNQHIIIVNPEELVKFILKGEIRISN